MAVITTLSLALPTDHGGIAWLNEGFQPCACSDSHHNTIGEKPITIGLGREAGPWQSYL